MKEGLGTFAQKKLSELRQFFKVPTDEELVANFPHDKQCSKSGKVNLIKKSVTIPGSGWEMSVSGVERMVRCEECGVSKKG